MASPAREAELVAASLAGDRSAFAVLLDRHRLPVRALAYRLLGDWQEAEDVTQEALLQAYLGLARLRRPDRFGSWVRGIAVNLAKMRLRHARGACVPLEESTGGRRVPELVARAGDGPSPQQAAEALELFRLVYTALAGLPEGQRRAVLLHYVDGLSCQETAALLGRSTGAVRVALHRARAELRARLRELAPDHVPTRKEIVPMVEVELHDVVVRMVPGEGADEAPRLASHLRIVLLRERAGERTLPIWVGASEGDALAFHLRSEATVRPLTADLMARLLEVSDSRVERVAISSLREDTFYAVVTIARDRALHELDARPSDALNLAVRARAPVFVDEEVMAAAGISEEDEVGRRMEERLRSGDEEQAEGEWRPLTAELLKALHAQRPAK